MESGLSTGDLALMGNNGFGNGNDFLWIFALLILAGGGFGGAFGNNSQAATHADIDTSMQFSALREGQTSNAAEIQRGIYEINAATKDSAYNNLSEIRDIQSAMSAGFAGVQNSLTNGFANMQKCCCETQRAIDSVNYNGAINTAAINANTTVQVQKVLDSLASNRMADMQSQINALQIANAMSGVVRYPSATTYNAGSSCFGSGCGAI